MRFACGLLVTCRYGRRRHCFEILQDAYQKHPETEEIPFADIKNLLNAVYGIKVRSAADFFCHPLKEYKCDGRKRNRRMLFASAMFEAL